MSPLQYAAKHHNVPLMKILLSAGADVGWVNKVMEWVRRPLAAGGVGGIFSLCLSPCVSSPSRYCLLLLGLFHQLFFSFALSSRQMN